MYGKTTGMEINMQKSTVCFNDLEAEVVQILLLDFSFKEINFKEGFKYIGFLLKVNTH